MLYKFIDENTIEKQPKTLTTIVIVEETDPETQEAITREVECIITNPTETQYREKGYKDLIDEKPEITNEQYLTFIYVDGETISKQYTINDKEIIEITDVCPEPQSDYEEYDYTLYYATYNELHHGFRLTQEAIARKQAEAERARLDKLECTKRVFCYCINEMKGVTYSQLMQIVESNEDFKMEWRECVQLLRGNQALNLAGQAIGVSSEDLDNIFKYANGEITLEDLQNA